MESTSPPAAQVPDISLPQRIWGALVSPRIVFESLRARPRLLGAIIVLAVLYMAAGFLLADLTLEQQLANLDEREGMTEDERMQAEKWTTMLTTKIGPLIGGLAAPVGVFLIAAILLFVGNVILGGEARFKQYAAGVAHSSMVAIPALLVRIPMARATGDLEVPTSLAALLPPDQSKTLLYNALAQLDVFGLWQLALVVILVSVMARVPTKKAAFGVVGAWLVWMLIWIPLQTFLSGLGGG